MYNDKTTEKTILTPDNLFDKKDSVKNPKLAERLLRELLVECGFNPYLTGYEYLIDAVLACYNEPELLRGKTKVLYPMLAKKYDINISNIDRNIRTLINSAWRTKKSDSFYLRTDCHFIENNQQPTCSDIINILENYVRLMVLNYD